MRKMVKGFFYLAKLGHLMARNLPLLWLLLLEKKEILLFPTLAAAEDMVAIREVGPWRTAFNECGPKPVSDLQPTLR